MAKYTVATERKHLLAPYGVQLLLEESIESARENGSITSWASSFISEAVRAALCDLDYEATQLVSRAQKWLRIAIAEREVTRFQYADEADRYVQLALCEWILTGILDIDHFVNACDFLNKYFEFQNDKAEIAHNLPTFFIAGKYSELVDHFTNCKKLSRPTNLRTIKCPGKMSLVLAEHCLSGQPNHETVDIALTAFLKYQMPVCVGVRRQGVGSLLDVPMWTYIDAIISNSSQPTGVQILRRVFNYVDKEAE